jgi:hypothetical protein
VIAGLKNSPIGAILAKLHFFTGMTWSLTLVRGVDGEWNWKRPPEKLLRLISGSLSKKRSTPAGRW